MRFWTLITILCILLCCNKTDYSVKAQTVIKQDTEILVQSLAVPEPLYADPQAVFNASLETWRQKQYEVYRLSIGNNLICISFLNYEEQRNFFWRLTYFSNQDKENYVIHPINYYAGMHSYNANDYSSEDLANFFNQLNKQNLVPEPGEALLLQMALSYKIIAQSNKGYFPLTGAIISFSRETEIKQRKRYLVHETMHGLFYTIPVLRKEIIREVNNLPADELAFWKIFLKHKGELDGRPGLSGYNIENQFLFVNEIFAHTMQCGYAALDDYFWNTYVTRMKKLFPETSDFLRKLEANKRTMFANLFTRFAELLKKYSVIENGELF